MAGTTGWADLGGTATGHTVGTLGATVGDGLPAGNWLALGIDNSAGGGSVYRQRAAAIDGTQYSTGDVLGVFAVMSHSDASGTTSAKLQVTNNGVAFSVLLDTGATGINNPGPVFGIFTVPASAGTLRLGLVLSLVAGANVTAYLGAVQVYNLTTGGLVGSA
jgi:hypothetical protein